MKQYGLLVDYKYCSGCHTCELACQQENNYDPEILGIEVKTLGPTKVSPKKWQYDYIPVPTDFCNSCGARRAKDKLPSCVHHCQAGCLEFGKIEELAKKMTSEKMLLFTLK